MAKLIPTGSLVSVLLLIVANASVVYRTTITTTEIDDSREGSESSNWKQCRQEARMKDLRSCEQYIRQSGSMTSSDEDMPEISTSGENEQQKQLRRCCDQVKQVIKECQYELIRSIIEDQLPTQRQTSMERARKIASSCDLRQQRQIQANPTSHQSCDEQIQRHQNLKQCQEYIRQQASQLKPKKGSRGSSQQLSGCCDHLKQIQSECRCEGLTRAVEQQQRQGELQGQAVFEAFRTAKDLPSMCNVSPSQCQFGSTKVIGSFQRIKMVNY